MDATSLGMSRRELLTVVAASMAMFVPLKVLAQTAVMHWPQLREAVGRSAA